MTSGTTAASTTLYLHPDAANGLSFEREVRGGSAMYKHYINAGGRVVAVLTTSSLTGNTSSSGTVNYLHYDHLGSVVAVTDSTGASAIERRSFDPWGRPRSTAGTPGSGELPNGLASATDRGFTMHEHLEGVGLIHMNGRVFDPTLARFTSADPLIQSPTSSQSYNRYAYVWNDPLNGLDPTGFCFLGKLGCIVRDAWKDVWHSTVGRIAVTVAVAYFAGEYVAEFVKSQEVAAFVEAGDYANAYATYYASSTTTSAVLGGAAGGFAGGFVGGNGSLKSGLQGAVTGAAFGYVGGFGGPERAMGHAAVGCASSMMGGGKCGSGAASALVSLGTTEITGGIRDPLARGIVVTVSGGITSKITGGTFENGALTAAYGYLFNFLSHAQFDRKTGVLEVEDADTAKRAKGLFFSGTGSDDGIEPGTYAILQRGGKDGFRLEAIDSTFGDDMNDKGQSLLRLHGPGRSYGCITACDSSNWAAVNDVIRNTAPLEVTVNTYKTIYNPLNGALWFRWQTGTEVVKYYGNLVVK